MLKKLTVLISIIAIFSSYAFKPVFAREISDSEQKAITLFTNLGIIDSKIDDYNADMSREEFAFYLCRLLKIDEKTADSVRYFIDVETNGYAANSINALTKRGIISGSEDKLFYPQNTIKYEEACKMVVSALGYDNLAASRGGYPTGYVYVCRTYDILRSVTRDNSGLDYASAFMMMYNAMETEISSVSLTDGKVMLGQGDKTIASIYWDMYDEEGTVTGLYGQSVFGKTASGESYLLLDDVLYDLDKNIDAQEFLGSYVKVYYTEEKGGGDRTVVSIENKSKTDDVVIAPKDFYKVQNGVLEYYNANGAQKRINLYNPAFVYNGMPLLSDIQNKMSNINKGSIVVKDGNNDGQYDTVIIEDYANFVVSAIIDSKFYNKLNQEVIDSDKITCSRVYNEAGILENIGDIKVGQVLAVAMSEDGENVKIIASSQSITGKISDIKEVDAVSYMTVDNHEYPIDNSYAKILTETYFKSEAIAFSVAKTYNIFTDTFGNVSYVVSIEEGFQIGYLLKGDLSTDDGEERAILKIVTAGNTCVKLPLADNVRINSQKYKNQENALNELPGTVDGVVQKQLIRYQLDSDGMISKIQTAVYSDADEYSGSAFRQVYAENAMQWYNSGRLGAKATITSDTIIFFVPVNEDDPDETNYKVVPTNVLVNDISYTCNAYHFTLDSVLADAVVCYYKPTDLMNNMPMYEPLIMVSQITASLDPDDMPTQHLIGYSRGARVEYDVPETVSLSGIKEGDLITFDYDINGNIKEDSAVTIVCKCGDIYTNYKPTWTENTHHDYLYTQSADGPTDYYRAGFQLSYGFVSKVNGTAVAWSHTPDNKFDEAANITGSIVIYEKNKKEGSRVHVGTSAELIPYRTAGFSASKIIFRTRSGLQWESFVYQ